MLSRYLIAAFLAGTPAATADPVATLRHPEPELSAVDLDQAMTDARATFPVFLEELRDSPWQEMVGVGRSVTEIAPDNPGNDDCCHKVKLLFPVGPGFSTGWLHRVTIIGDDLFEAELLHDMGMAGFQAGDRIRFNASHIADWRYSLYEQTYGDFYRRSQMTPPPKGEFLTGKYAPLPEIPE